MTVEMVLNDLSLLSPVSERGIAREMMSDLIDVLIEARQYGVKTLRTQNDPYNLILSPDYPIASWLNDNQVDLEERRFFRRKLVYDIRIPLLADITDPSIYEEKSLSDFKYQGELAYALGIAYLLNGIAVSFCSEPKWNCDSLDLEIIRLENGTDSENLTEGLLYSNERLIHASKSEHIAGHKEQIEYRFRTKPWHPQDELLPCYFTASGKNLLAEWLDSLSKSTREVIQAKLNQVKQGNLGDHKSVGEGVWELRIFSGPAYRIYFGRVEQDKLLLLCAGDKSTQAEDIIRAKKYWQDYRQKPKTSF